MKRILLKISFDGTNYHGWQYQKNAITIQKVLSDALEKLLGVPTDITGCSRTDAGVHAGDFACHLDCADNIPEDAFLRGLNSILPNDIAVKSCNAVALDFHARYSTIGKRYSYGMYCGGKDPFDERYFLHLSAKPDIELMNAFAKSIIGKHDFYGFSSSGRSVEDTIRTISDCFITEENNKIFFKVTADGFLYNMVRILAGTALAIGYGKLPVEISNQVFDKKDRSLAGDTLPPNGLFLEKVFY